MSMLNGGGARGSGGTADYKVLGRSLISGIPHSGIRTLQAGNSGMGQSQPGFFKLDQSAEIQGTRVSNSLFTRSASRAGTAQAGSSTSITLDSGASSTSSIYVYVRIASGTGVGQARAVTTYDGATKVASVASAWDVTPDATSVFEVFQEVFDTPVRNGLAQGGGTTTVTLDAGASTTTDKYRHAYVWIIAGTGSNQVRKITAYNGTTKVATVDANWTTIPDTTSQFEVVAGWHDGKFAFSYAAGAPGSGTWLEVAASSAIHISVIGTLDATGTAIKVCPISPIDATFDHGKGTNAFRSGVSMGGGLIVMAPNSSDSIAVLNAETMSAAYYAHNAGSSAYTGATRWTQHLAILAPHTAADIAIFDVRDGSIIKIPHGQGSQAYRAVCIVGKYAIFAPRDASAIMRMDLTNGSLAYFTHGKGTGAFNGVVSAMGYAWLVPSGSNQDLVRFDPSSGTQSLFPCPYAGYGGAVFDGANIWLLPTSSNYLTQFNLTSMSFTGHFAHGESGTFTGGAFDGFSIWLAPQSNANIVRYDIESGAFFKYAHGKGTASVFHGAVFAGPYVILIPNSSASAVRCRIPEVGRAEVQLTAPVPNGTVATTMSSVGPTGASTSIQGWIPIRVDGMTRFVPFW